MESGSNIPCLQETKRQEFSQAYLKNFCPPNFDEFHFLPSNGASGGILVSWQGASFSGEVIFQNEYAVSISFTSHMNEDTWVLTTVYAPCTYEGKRQFLNWFHSIQMPDEINWLIVGDFNLIRRPEDRNKEGGDIQEMYLFNEAINSLGLIEIPLHGRKYTWTNKQTEPLLERLDWFFSSASWTLSYPNTAAKTLLMETSDHWPCVIEISTSIPRAQVFRFENCWLMIDSFLPTAQQNWSIPTAATDSAKNITAKFKNLRRILRTWKTSISSLKLLIQRVKSLIYLLESIELLRDLSIQEWNFRNILCDDHSP